MSLTFNTFNLQSANVLTSSINYRSIPAREIVLEDIARKPGKKLISEEFAERHIKLAGWILGSDSTDLIAQIDSLHTNVTRKTSGTLSIDSGREIEAIVASVSVEEPHYTQSMVPFEIEFIAAEPFWKGAQQTVSLAVTSGSATQPITKTVTLTISGSVYAEPSITYTAPGSTGSTTTSGIQIAYNPAGEKVTWSGTSNATLAYGNFVKFDYANQLILEGSTKIEATGVYSRWEPGETTFVTTFSGSQQGGTLNFIYRPRYL